MHTGSLDTLTTLPVGVLIGLGALTVIELALDVIALIDLYRRPISRVALGNKWAWVAIIVLVNTLGAIIYLIVGRRPAPPRDPTPSDVTTDRRASIAEALYGDDGNSVHR
jgi:hypothetical protein